MLREQYGEPFHLQLYERKIPQRVQGSPSVVQVQMFKPENPDTFGVDVIQKQEFPSQDRRLWAEYGQLQTKLDQIVHHHEGTKSPREIRMKLDESNLDFLWSRSIGSGVQQ